jgi:lycopene cyclase CruA
MRRGAVTPSDGARSRVREAGGPELLERLDHLDARAGERAPAAPVVAPDAAATPDLDVVLAGGGLWSLLAAMLAERGLRVAVVERARAAQPHREWNASERELEALVRAGLVDRAGLEELVVARYRRGVCRFAGGGAYDVTGVLDCAVDATGLLARGRTLAEQRGVRFLDGHAVVGHAEGPAAVRVAARSAAGEIDLVARWMVDARGASSPYATADLACPTVGGVVEGLAEGDAPDEMRPDVGDILATIDGAGGGRQHLWEAFPGRARQTTVYLFYYADSREPRSLAELYGRFFRDLGRYKRGNAHLLRPTFGVIPGWSRLCAPPRAPGRRVVLVGDAAARHSPLTCCGFGATLRSLERTADALARASVGTSPDEPVVDDAPVHAVTGALARVLASRTFRGQELNRLLDAAFRSLHAMGNETYSRLLRDEIEPWQAIRFVRTTAARHPEVWGHVIRALGPWAAGRWAIGLARAAASGRRAGSPIDRRGSRTAARPPPDGGGDGRERSHEAPGAGGAR